MAKGGGSSSKVSQDESALRAHKRQGCRGPREDWRELQTYTAFAIVTGNVIQKKDIFFTNNKASVSGSDMVQGAAYFYIVEQFLVYGVEAGEFTVPGLSDEHDLEEAKTEASTMQAHGGNYGRLQARQLLLARSNRTRGWR